MVINRPGCDKHRMTAAAATDESRCRTAPFRGGLSWLVCVLVWLAVPVTAAPATQVTLHAGAVSDSFGDRLRSASLTVATAARDDATAQDLLAAAQADYARLTGVLFAAGFYGGTVRIAVDGREAAAIAPLAAPQRIGRIVIEVAPGTRFRFSRAEVTPRAPGTELPGDFRPGGPARGDLVGAAVKSGIDGWRAAGHAKARLAEQDLVADHRDNTLAAHLILEPGPRLRFGDLRVAQGDRPSRVRADRIRAIAGLPEGAVFDPADLATAERRLRRTGAFTSARIEEAETPTPDGRLPMSVRVVDAKPRRFGVGAELASFEGLKLSGFWMHRNLLGGAERLRLEFEAGGIGGDSGGQDFRFGGRFERPATFTPDTALFLEAAIEERDEPDYQERNARLGGGLSHVFSDELTGEAGLRYQQTEIDDAISSRNVGHLLLPALLTWDARDDPLDARAGYYLGLEAKPFLGFQGGGDGARLFTDARAYHGLGGVTLAARAQFGTVAGASVGSVPPDMLFYSGGVGTVRGQPYQELGVTLPGGGEVGGRSFAGFSGEVRVDVAGGKGQVVAFADTGFVGADAWGAGGGTWQSGAGLGGRYRTGVGPIRVDVATPLDGDTGRAVELYVGIGQAF